MTKLNKQPAIYNLALIACILQIVNIFYVTFKELEFGMEFFDTADLWNSVLFLFVYAYDGIVKLIPIIIFYIGIRKSHKKSGKVLLGLYFLYFALKNCLYVIERGLAAAAGFSEGNLLQMVSVFKGQPFDIVLAVTYAFIAVDIFKGAVAKRRLNVFLTIDIFIIVLYHLVVVHAYNIIVCAFEGDISLLLDFSVSALFYVGLLLNRAAVLTLVKHNTLITKKLPEDAAHPSPEQDPEN